MNKISFFLCAFLIAAFAIISFPIVYATCTDSDGGINYYVKGILSINETINGTHHTGTYYDICLNGGNIIHEWSCNGMLPIESVYSCPGECIDGACLNASEGAPPSSGGGGGSPPTNSTICVRATPTVTISPSTQTDNVGTAKTYNYGVTIKNNDDADCGPSIFYRGGIHNIVEGGYITDDYAGTSLPPINPGTSLAYTLYAHTQSYTPAGTYYVGVLIENMNAVSYIINKTANLVLISNQTSTPNTTAKCMHFYYEEGRFDYKTATEICKDEQNVEWQNIGWPGHPSGKRGDETIEGWIIRVNGKIECKFNTPAGVSCRNAGISKSNDPSTCWRATWYDSCGSGCYTDIDRGDFTICTCSLDSTWGTAFSYYASNAWRSIETKNVCSTTNQTIPPNTTTKTCKDTDSGINYGVKGTATQIIYSETGNGGSASSASKTDYCSSSSDLIEYKCDTNNDIQQIGVSCTLSGLGSCMDGACLQTTTNQTIPPNTATCTEHMDANGCIITQCSNVTSSISCPVNTTDTCTDSDNGKNYYIKGIVIDVNGRVVNDSCSIGFWDRNRIWWDYRNVDSCDANTNNNPYSSDNLKGSTSDRCLVFEAYCNENNENVSNYMYCPNGCKDGACININVIPVKDKVPVDMPNNEDKTKTVYVCDGCANNNICYPIGYRSEGKYCTPDKNFKAQSNPDSSCQNNFECESNVCASEKCISGDLLQRILAWFKNLFD